MAAQMIASATIPAWVPSVMPVSGMPTPKETIAKASGPPRVGCFGARAPG